MFLFYIGFWEIEIVSRNRWEYDSNYEGRNGGWLHNSARSTSTWQANIRVQLLKQKVDYQTWVKQNIFLICFAEVLQIERGNLLTIFFLTCIVTHNFQRIDRTVL